jgi:FkbM family methyltransferase
MAKLFNPKKTEFFLKKFLKLSDSFLLKRRAMRYLKKGEREMRVLKDLVDKSRASIDIGVYRGVYAFHLSYLSKFVYAFEANSLLHSRLLSAFGNKKNVKVENLAISSSSGHTDLRIPIRDDEAEYDVEQKYALGTATIHDNNDLGKLRFHTIKNIKKITLDKYDFNHKVGFVKIDVEGHELDIIRGATNFLKNNKPVLLIEIEEQHTGMDPNLIISEIKNFGYDCFYVNEEYEIKPLVDAQSVKNNNFIFLPD